VTSWGPRRNAFLQGMNSLKWCSRRTVQVTANENMGGGEVEAATVAAAGGAGKRQQPDQNEPESQSKAARCFFSLESFRFNLTRPKLLDL
jgi:hypothetical protein